MLRGPNVILRTVRERDLETLLALQSNLESRGPFYPIDLPSEAHLKRDFHEHGFWRDDFGRLLICDADDRVLGSIGFFKTTHYYNALEVGYILYDEASRGQGLMTEALGLLVRYLFASKDINRVQLTAFVENTASRRVAEKAGFQFEGIARGAVRHHGSAHDLAVYSIVRADVVD